MSRQRDSLTGKALELIRREGMLHKGENVLVALSGGADSMALLYFLFLNRAELHLGSIYAAHINHGLRGTEAERDEDFVKKQCDILAVPLYVLRADVSGEAKARGEGLEEAGRRIRYDFFAKQAIELNACVATAHTFSDSMETVLLHIARGCGIRGLCGIPAIREINDCQKSIKIIRPLIGCTRTEVEEYCRLNAIRYITDSTNSDPAYSRNRIRSHVLPQLKTINDGIEPAFERLMRHAHEDEEALDTLTEKALKDAEIHDGYGGYDAFALLSLPTGLLKRALYKSVCYRDEKAARRLTDQQITTIINMLSGHGAVTVCRGLEVRVSQGRFLTLHTIQDSDNDENSDHKQIIPLKIGISCSFFGRIYRPTLMTLDEYEKCQKIHKNLLKYSLNYDKITDSLFLRSRLPGDAYRPAGRGVKKTLKKLLGEEKIPASMRDALPVVCDAHGIVMIGGLGCDERVAVNMSCERVFVLRTED